MKKLSLILALFLILGLAAGCSGAGEVAYVQSVSMLAGLGPVGAVTRFGGDSSTSPSRNPPPPISRRSRPTMRH